MGKNKTKKKTYASIPGWLNSCWMDGRQETKKKFDEARIKREVKPAGSRSEKKNECCYLPLSPRLQEPVFVRLPIQYEMPIALSDALLKCVRDERIVDRYRSNTISKLNLNRTTPIQGYLSNFQWVFDGIFCFFLIIGWLHLHILWSVTYPQASTKEDPPFYFFLKKGRSKRMKREG